MIAVNTSPSMRRFYCAYPRSRAPGFRGRGSARARRGFAARERGAMSKVFLVGLVAAVALVAAGAPVAQPARPASASWESDWFVSPTHNIHCRWFWTEALVACMTENNGRMVGVTVWGEPFMRWGTGG